MPNVKISELPVASTPLAGTELVPVVQGGITEQVTVANLTAGRAIAAADVTVTNLSASQAVFTDASDKLVSVATTGTGSVVLATSPTLTTPNLGTPSAATLTNATGLPLTTGVTGTLPVANGGTGASTLTANNVLLGNGTSAVQVVAPGASGNILTSDGTTWTSAAPAAITAVSTFSGGTTGLTPSTPTSGAVSLAGTLAVANGGTGQTTYTDGQLLIGNSTGNTLTKATLTAGTGITVTNGGGSITIAASSTGGAQDYIVQSYGIV